MKGRDGNKSPNEYFLPLENEMGGCRKKKRRREDQTVRSLCWCDEGWSGDGEQSVRCGHGWTTQALHKSPFFKGEERKC